MGGPGKGAGGVAPETATDTNFENKFSESKIGEGKTLQEMYVYGVPEKGDAPSAYRDATKAASQEAASSLSKTRVPREMESMVKEYFDSVESDVAAD
jgi:hypothetical protein